MEKLKNKIIHWLGGYTLSEKYEGFLNGRHHAFLECKVFAKTLYGKDSEEWCKEMYKFLEDNIKNSAP